MNAITDLHNTMAERLKNAGLYEQAAEDFRRVVEHAPRSAPAWIGLGVCSRFKGSYEAAEHALQRALGLEPESVDAHFELGNLLRVRGFLERAQAEYRAVLELAPHHAEARYLLSVATPGDTPTSIPLTLVADLFDAYAPTFEDHLVRRLRYCGPWLLRQAVGPSCGIDRRSLTVVDLGCGTGLCGSVFRDVARRLVGVDISSRMLDQARHLGVYDELRLEDVITNLRRAERTFDLALAADVLVYFGELAELFSACGTALRKGGRFAFTAEATDAEGFVLMSGGRFAHGRRYIEATVVAAGLSVERYSESVSRFENGQPVRSHVYVVRQEHVT